MKNTFKKTLLAAAVAGFSVNAFAAADITATAPLGVSVEGQLEVLAADDVVVTLGAEYAVGDVITIAFSGAALDVDTVDTTVTVTKPAGTLTLGLLEATADMVKYRVTENSDQTTTVGSTLTLTGLEFDGADVIAAGGVTATYSAVTNTGLSLDSTGTKLSTRVFYTANELAPKVATKLDSIINVEADRLNFTTVAADQLVINSALRATVPGVDLDGDGTDDLVITEGAISVSKVSYKITSDFSWVIDTSETAGIQYDPSAIDITGCNASGAIKVTATELTFACTDTLANVTVAFDPRQGETKFAAPLSPKAFGVEMTYAFADGNGDNDTSAFTGLNGGSWTLNGSVVRVPYMVLQNGRFSAILNVTNHSAKDGAIFVDVFDEQGEPVETNYPAGISKAGSVTSVVNAVKSALLSNGYTLNDVTKFSVQIVTNVPEDDVIVYAAYADSQNGGERAIVNNDSKVQTK